MPEISEQQLSPPSRMLWQKALSAIQLNNIEFVIPLVQSVLTEAPGFLEGRKVLRKCEVQIHGSKQNKKTFFGMDVGGGGSSKISSQIKKDPLAALPLIEKELEKNPVCEATNDLLFEACVKCELFETAAFALETIRTYSPSSVKLLHKLAEFYLSRELPAKASEVYTDIVKQVPNDSVAIKGAKDSSARASMSKQRWDENTNIRDLMRDAAGNEELEQAARSGLTRDQLEQRRDRVIEKYNTDPNHLATVKDLAGLYEQLEDWTNAHTFFQWAHTLSNGDVALATKSSEMRDRSIEQEFQYLEQALAADPSNEALAAKLKEHRAHRLADQVAEAKVRIEQNPTDAQLRFDLGKALYESEDYAGAIPHLQQATRNPHIRTKVLLLLGRTFNAKKMYDLAIKQLADALADLQVMDSTKKEILYEKGLIHQQMGDQTAALESFKQIYEVDYGYRDVAQRVEASYTS